MFGDEDSTPEIAAEMAIGFANWLKENYIVYDSYYIDPAYNRYTTEELYKLYLESL